MDITALDNPIEMGHKLNQASSVANYRSISQKPVPIETLASRYGLYCGSGGQLSCFNFTICDAKPKFNPQLKAQLKHTQNTFGLTQEQLAKVCGLKSRKTLNNWYNGDSNPRTESLNRIFELAIITEAFLQSGVIYHKHLLEKPVLKGLSLLDLLSQEPLDKDKILFAGTDLHFENDSDIKLVDPFAK